MHERVATDSNTYNVIGRQTPNWISFGMFYIECTWNYKKREKKIHSFFFAIKLFTVKFSSNSASHRMRSVKRFQRDETSFTQLWLNVNNNWSAIWWINKSADTAIDWKTRTNRNTTYARESNTNKYVNARNKTISKHLAERQGKNDYLSIIDILLHLSKCIFMRAWYRTD